MSSNNRIYNIVFPQNKKDLYEANNTVDFILSFEGKMIVPGSIVICFEEAKYRNKSLNDRILSTEEIISDPDAGAHCFFRDITTNLSNVGITENFTYYPRFVAEKTRATKMRRSLGVETTNCIEGKVWNESVARGYSLGTETGVTDGEWISRVIHPDIGVNKSSAPIPGTQVGGVRLRIRMAPDIEVLYGEDCTANAGYYLRNLEIRYETMPDDGTRPPLQMEFYQVEKQIIETNNANLATFVSNPTDSVHASMNRVTNEGSLTENYLRAVPVPGKAPLSNVILPNYGFERIYFAINDTQTALTGFTLEDRAEITWNYLRSYVNEPSSYSNLMQVLQSPRPNGYGFGITFGQPIDFSNQKFEVELQSEISSLLTADKSHSVYLYFRSLLSL